MQPDIWSRLQCRCRLWSACGALPERQDRCADVPQHIPELQEDQRRAQGQGGAPWHSTECPGAGRYLGLPGKYIGCAVHSMFISIRNPWSSLLHPPRVAIIESKQDNQQSNRREQSYAAGYLDTALGIQIQSTRTSP